MDEKENKEMGDKLIEQALELWINPEIERRKQLNTLPENFKIHSVQVLMNFDAPNEVRFNEEVKVIIEGKTTREIVEGEKVIIDEVLENITNVKLTERDGNAGHFTMIFHRGSWHINFDFRYNASRCLEHSKAANEFLTSAKLSLNRNNMRAFVDNLFSATELMAKAIMLMHDEVVFKTKKHSTVHERYNKFGKLGNVNSEYTKLLNRLASLRPTARYINNEFSLTKEEAKKMFKTANQMNKDLLKQIPEIVNTIKK